MILHLGVADIPYAHELAPDVGKRDKVPGGTQTTGDVATWLEDKYHVMEVFFQEHGDDVAKSLEGSLAGALEALLLGGAPASLDAFGPATMEIHDLFQHFLDSQEIEHLGIPGVPTKAALMGVNRRRKSKRGPRRPSFIDTGIFEANFFNWID